MTQCSPEITAYGIELEINDCVKRVEFYRERMQFIHQYTWNGSDPDKNMLKLSQKAAYYNSKKSKLQSKRKKLLAL